MSLIQAIRAIFMFVFMLFFTFESMSQSSAISAAVRELQAGNLDSSKVLIDQATNHEETKSDIKTWYYRGFIYKKLYTAKESDNKQSQYRNEAISSFKVFFEIDTMSDLRESAYKTVKYLSSTLYNDAAGLLNEGQYDKAIENFEAHKSSMKIIDESYDASSLEKQFYLVLGQQYNQLYEQDRKTNKEYFEKTKEAYLYVIKIDSNDMSANYNMGLLYYNDAVDIIKNLDYDMDLISLELIQDECIQLFSKSEPYMLKALGLDPCRAATYTGLSGIYFSLNKMDDSRRVQEQLDFLKEPKELQLFNGELTENSEINYMPMCASKPGYYLKVVKGTDGNYYKISDKQYKFVPRKGISYLEMYKEM